MTDIPDHVQAWITASMPDTTMQEPHAMTEFLRSFAPNVDFVDFLKLLEEEERLTRDNAVRKGAYGYEYWCGRREALAILRLRLEEAGVLKTGELPGGRTAPR